MLERAPEGVTTSDAGWDPALDLNEDLRVDDVDVEIESALVQVMRDRWSTRPSSHPSPWASRKTKRSAAGSTPRLVRLQLSGSASATMMPSGPRR
jgi:hypothetical protein